MFRIDTAEHHVDAASTAAQVEAGQYIVVRDWKRARSLTNKIRENIEAMELVEQLDAYWQREEMTLDALHLFDPTITAELAEAYETHRSCLVHGGAARPTHSDTAHHAQPGNDGKDQEDYW